MAFGLLRKDIEETPKDLGRGDVGAQDGDRRVFVAGLQHLLVAAHLLPRLLDALHEREFLRRVAAQLESPGELR
jgi:hypothetical protein